MTLSSVIECNNLTKDYGHNNGLFDLNLSLYESEVFGLIGPNGAGKSTLIKLLMDLIRPSSGSAKIFGLDTRADSIQLKKQIGYLPGELMQFPNVTAGYILNLMLNLRGISDRNYMNELCEMLDLDLGRKYEDLSHGNKQKVALIQALMHKPRLLILDEPTLGLDPIIQRELRSILQNFSSNGNTILLSSHVLSEVESICTRIGLINKGRIVRVGTLKELRREQVHKFTITIEGEVPGSNVLVSLGANSIEIQDNIVKFDFKGSIDAVLKYLTKYNIIELDSRELSLEEVFFSEVKS